MLGNGMSPLPGDSNFGVLLAPGRDDHAVLMCANPSGAAAEVASPLMLCRILRCAESHTVSCFSPPLPMPGCSFSHRCHAFTSSSS